MRRRGIRSGMGVWAHAAAALEKLFPNPGSLAHRVCGRSRAAPRPRGMTPASASSPSRSHPAGRGAFAFPPYSGTVSPLAVLLRKSARRGSAPLRDRRRGVGRLRLGPRGSAACALGRGRAAGADAARCGPSGGSFRRRLCPARLALAPHPAAHPPAVAPPLALGPRRRLPPPRVGGRGRSRNQTFSTVRLKITRGGIENQIRSDNLNLQQVVR